MTPVVEIEVECLFDQIMLSRCALLQQNPAQIFSYRELRWFDSSLEEEINTSDVDQLIGQDELLQCSHT